MATPPPPRSNFSVPRATCPAWDRAGAGSAGGPAATLAPADPARGSLLIAVKSGEVASRRAEVEQKALALRIFTQKQWQKLLASRSGQPVSLLPHFPTCPEAKCLADARGPLPHFPSLPTAAAHFHLGKFFLSPPPVSFCLDGAESPPRSVFLVCTRVLMRFPDSVFCGIEKGSAEVHISQDLGKTGE